MKKHVTRIAAAALTTLAAGPALAHPGHGAETGLLSGFLHPLTGADHLLAMVAVGLWAAMIGGRALLALPAAFVALMTLSALAGMGLLGLPGGEIPLVETGIALTLVALGLAVALNLRASVALAAAACALFATAHGWAHGAELPFGADAAAYVAGFAAATLVLHAVGIGLGMLIARGGAGWITRGAGAATAVLGVGLLVV